MSTPVRVDSYNVVLAETPATIREARRERTPHLFEAPPSPYGYKCGCRCEDCTRLESARSERSKRKHGFLPARRMRGLLPKPLVKARRDEGRRRRGAARERAFQSLRDAHRDEYDALMVRHLSDINAEAGPLPGDDWYKPSPS